MYRRLQEEGYYIPDPQYIAWLNGLDDTSSGKMVDKLTLSKHACGMLNPTKRISLEEYQQIKQATLGQHTSAAWKKYHTKTITSSNFRIVCKRRQIINNFIRWLLHPPDISHIPTIHHGRQFEPTSFLGASPDQLIEEMANWAL